MGYCLFTVATSTMVSTLTIYASTIRISTRIGCWFGGTLAHFHCCFHDDFI